VLLEQVLAAKRRLGLAFEPGFERCLCECQTEEERRAVRPYYADWLEEHGHLFEGACFRAGTDPAHVLVGEGAAWGLRRGRFAAHPAFRRERLRFPLLGGAASPAPGRC
jgi:hypothetical protein